MISWSVKLPASVLERVLLNVRIFERKHLSIYSRIKGLEQLTLTGS
jgi:hypothetical protein